MELRAAWGAEQARAADAWSPHRFFAVAVLGLSTGLLALPPAVALFLLVGWIG